jgi:(6-4)DNA photolyase
MSFFMQELIKCQPDPQGRRWLYVPYDQITDRIGPLSRENPKILGIVLVENPWKAARRPYHRQKLALILANLRHFALEQGQRGVAVRHVVTRGPYRTALEPLVKELGPLQVMEPLDVWPRKITDWFWVAYTDSYDWVVEPNVMAMGTFAVGKLMTTKP